MGFFLWNTKRQYYLPSKMSTHYAIQAIVYYIFVYNFVLEDRKINNIKVLWLLFFPTENTSTIYLHVDVDTHDCAWVCVHPVSIVHNRKVTLFYIYFKFFFFPKSTVFTQKVIVRKNYNYCSTVLLLRQINTVFLLLSTTASSCGLVWSHSSSVAILLLSVGC